MKKFLIEVIIVLAVAIYLYYANNGEVPGVGKTILIAPLPHLTQTPTPSLSYHAPMMKTLFVPYWSLPSKAIDTSTYDRLVYFGISVNKTGIDQTEPGFNGMQTFLTDTSTAKQRLLGVRMIDSTVNATILDDPVLQKKIIDDAITIARTHGFSGVVLDFEISALGFHSVVQSISDFETHFATAVKAKNMQFFATMYGDTYARLRPFDVSTIAKNSDGIMIMMYDFHKADGDPGPNFPLHDKDGYDMSVMTTDFLNHVPANKLTVIFGLFGYDWPVDTSNHATAQAEALSYNAIKQKFLTTCNEKNCHLIHDKQSAETEVSYVSKNNQLHTVWFEDPLSVITKTTFLETRKISSIGYWAYSYF